MTDQISWYVHLTVKPGHMEDFQTLTDQMVESTRDERGALVYERFISDDGGDVHIYERYASSRAAASHLLSFKKTYGGRFSLLVDRKQFAVFGTPSQELRTLLDSFGATYADLLAGFSRFDP